MSIYADEPEGEIGVFIYGLEVWPILVDGSPTFQVFVKLQDGELREILRLSTEQWKRIQVGPRQIAMQMYKEQTDRR